MTNSFHNNQLQNQNNNQAVNFKKLNYYSDSNRCIPSNSLPQKYQNNYQMNNQNYDNKKNNNYIYQNRNNQMNYFNNNNFNNNNNQNNDMNNNYNQNKNYNNYMNNNANKQINKNSQNHQNNNRNQYNKNNNNDMNQNQNNQINKNENNNNENNNKHDNDNKKQNNNEIKLKERRYKPDLCSSYLCSISNYSSIIDRNESNIIKNLVEHSYVTSAKSEDKSLSSIINEIIKEKLGGKWFVFVNKINRPISFNISFISDSDLLIMKIGNSEFSIAKLDY